MAVTYFTPKENMLYSICFGYNEKTWETFCYDNQNIHGRVIDDQYTRNFPDESLWQFFKVAENSYTIANYKYGTLYKIDNSNGTVSIKSGNLQKNTPIVTPIYGQDGGDDLEWVQLLVRTTDNQGIIHAQPNLDHYLRVEAVTDFRFSIKEEKMNPAAETLAEINPAEEIDEPTFVNGTAPTVYPAMPTLMNEYYVPYFMVKDMTLSNMGDRIKQSPYYILRQYGQFSMVAEYKNGSVGSVTFVETWQYGWSATVSANVSAQFGFELGGEIEENEIVVKEEEEAATKLNFGIDLGATAGGSGSYSKQIRAEAPPSKAIAIYGVSANFELYQGDGVSAIAKPNIPMKTNRRYVSISEDYPYEE